MVWAEIAKTVAEVAKEGAKETTKEVGKGVIPIDIRKPAEPQGLKYKDMIPPKEQVNLDKRIPECVTGIKNKISEVNGYKFTTDKLGRTISAEGQLKYKPETGRNKKMQKEAGGKDRLKTDDGAHLFGRQFGGVGEKNLVAMDGILNKGPYNRLETKWANAVKNGDKVYVKIDPKYAGNSLRPDSFKVNYSINGEKFKTTFSNKPNAYAR